MHRENPPDAPTTPDPFEFRFTCTRCGDVHEGLPDLAFDWPFHYGLVPPDERRGRCVLTADTCVIEDRDFFVRGCLELPLLEAPQAFGLGVWVSLSRRNLERYVELSDRTGRLAEGPWFGWLSNRVPGYPDTLNLKTHVHLRPHPLRPRIVLEPTQHPLAVHQREGIPFEKVARILEAHLH